ncbi:TPA: hypothetical protein PXS10_004246 [Yersinia enterocolitica]|uniref:hypothetical protein n=1 Tax=Yersinia proxima TaxID=2890316 RepID=UPI001D109DC5|nr:hypothetical protein [Yersinia proxima]HDL8521602.1 hypothetical protein [Yersinia enterocolitica]
MRKVKWMVLNSPLLLGEIVEKLSYDPFSEDKGSGFIFSKIRENEIQGRYVEKYTIEEKINNLYGEQTTIDRTEYRVTEFHIDKDSIPLIALINPPRTIKPFILAIVRNLGLGINLEEIEVNPFEWIEPLERKLPTKVIQIDLSQIRVAEFALAKMQISSTQDLKKHYFEKIKNKKGRVDKLLISINSPEFSGKVKILRSGMVYIEMNHPSKFSDILFQSLKFLLFK